MRMFKVFMNMFLTVLQIVQQSRMGRKFFHIWPVVESTLSHKESKETKD